MFSSKCVYFSCWPGFLSDGHCPGWQAVPVHDPQVQDAANHAIQTIQQRSNSLFPYVLQEIVHAKAEVSSSYLIFLFLHVLLHFHLADCCMIYMVIGTALFYLSDMLFGITCIFYHQKTILYHPWKNVGH